MICLGRVAILVLVIHDEAKNRGRSSSDLEDKIGKST